MIKKMEEKKIGHLLIILLKRNSVVTGMFSSTHL